jgi:hypothetical protein
MSPVDTRSLYFEAVPVALRDTIGRVGANVHPAEFVEAVVETWRAVEVVSEEEVQARFRASRPYRDFRALLQDAARQPALRDRAANGLVIGCGHGLAGRSSAYAASVAREVLASDGISCIERLDLTSHMPAIPQRRYDLVVSHSLLHFLHDPRPICRLLQEMIAPGCVYVMANEPNARFWMNPVCLREMEKTGEAQARTRRWRKLASPSRYWARLRRLAHSGEPRDWVARMNLLLRQRIGLTAELSAKEIVRIIDPHLPDHYPGAYPLGSQGLSWSDLEAGPLLGLRVDAVRTSGYVLRDNPERIPERWRPIDEKLASDFPLDGCSFSALWHKPPSGEVAG